VLGDRRIGCASVCGLVIKVDKLRLVHPTDGRHAKRFPPFTIKIAGVVLGIAALNLRARPILRICPFAADDGQALLMIYLGALLK
jgi:hypothetical protein